MQVFHYFTAICRSVTEVENAVNASVALFHSYLQMTEVERTQQIPFFILHVKGEKAENTNKLECLFHKPNTENTTHVAVCFTS